jgi:PBP1b-binding outer membrane lipoprotein LpoB
MKKIYSLILCVVVAGVVVGCGDKTPSAVEDKKLKDQFAQKEFDINKVPEKDRAMVESIMKANSGAQSKK